MKSISVAAATGGKCEFDGGFDGAAKTGVNQNDERERVDYCFPITERN
jgi:hypothetical protein